MSVIKSLIDNLRKESDLQKQQYEELLECWRTNYKQLSNDVCDMKEQNKLNQESCKKYFNELMQSKNILCKNIDDNEKSTNVLPLSIKKQELFLKFMSSANDSLNKAPVIISLLETSSNDNFDDLSKLVNSHPKAVLQDIEDVNKCHNSLVNTYKYMEIINQNKEVSSSEDSMQIMDGSIFEN